MPAARHESFRKLGTAAGLFILAGIIKQLECITHPLPSSIFFLTTNFIYIGLAFAWGISISRRILHSGMRRQLLLGCAMTVLWLLLRAMKYRLFGEHAVTRYLWYLYYVPQVLAPLFSFFAALQLGHREDAALCRKWYLLLIPAFLMIFGMLTNDLHQLAFRFSPDMKNWGADYSHGPIYFMVMTWMIGFMLAAMFIIYHKCRISESRSYAWIPLCVFFAGMLLSLLSFLDMYTFHKLPECICLTFIAMWESCLQVGLLPTNSRYLRFFSEATVAAQIADHNGQVLYRSKAAPQLSLEQMKAADSGAFFLNNDLRLQSAPVHDGHVYWIDDLTQVNRIKEQMEEIHDRLAEENELIRAETELKRRRAQIEEKNRLFDHISRILRPQLSRMDEMLASGQKQDLQLLCILGAYVKRRGNLVLICDKDTAISVDELSYCIRESFIYLTEYGVACGFYQFGQGKVGGAELQLAYDFFEDCLEAALPTLSALMVRVECSDVFSIRLMMEDVAGLPDIDRYTDVGNLTLDQSDGECCITLIFARGGVRE